MSEFYLPYNFIPATGKIGDADTPTAHYDYHLTPEEKTAANKIDINKTNASTIARHDLYLNEHLSGRLICRITTVTPTVVGNKHNGASPTKIDLYRWDNKIAIPANSLRGMISNVVEILSQSALRVLDKEYWPSFKAIHPNLLPWHSERSCLTPAELIFGAVEDNETQDDNKDNQSNNEAQSRSLATRIRFYDALMHPDCNAKILPPTILKELSAPEPRAKDAPPSWKGEPFNIKSGTKNHYFKKNNASLEHQEVRNALDSREPLEPHGRKFYLLHRTVNYQKKKDDSNARKSKCELINKEQTFYFHIDFDNLSQPELILLICALQPPVKVPDNGLHGAELTLLICALQPDENFHHRIGLGKSLGLGIVTVKICDLFIKKPAERYSQLSATNTTKYHQHEQFFKDCGWQQLSSRYKLEIEALEALKTAEEFKVPEDQTPKGNSLIDTKSLELLKQTGKYDSLKKNIEVRWRDGLREQACELPSLSDSGKELPICSTQARPKTNKNHTKNR